MTGLAVLWGFAEPAFRSIAAAPRWLWIALALAGGACFAVHWQHAQVSRAHADGAAAQMRADAARTRAAADAAARAQHARVAAAAARQAEISKGTTDALTHDRDDLARRYDALRLRWAAYRADPGTSGDGRTVALSRPAAGADDAACAARGWVAFDSAAAAALAADAAIAKDDAWIAWAAAQAAAWPAGAAAPGGVAAAAAGTTP